MHLLSSRKQTTRAAGGSSLAFSSAWWGGSVVGARLARTERKQGRHLTRVCGRGNDTGLPWEMARGTGQFRYKGKDRSSYLGGGELKGAGHPKGLRPAPACASVLGACPTPMEKPRTVLPPSTVTAPLPPCSVSPLPACSGGGQLERPSSHPLPALSSPSSHPVLPPAPYTPD